MSVDTLARELRYACRLLLRTPGTSVLVLMVLGLALAGNIALFSIVDTTLFKPQPLPQVERICGGRPLGRPTSILPPP